MKKTEVHTDQITFLHNTNAEIYGIISEIKERCPELSMAVHKMAEASAEIHKKITQLLRDEKETTSKEVENKSILSESKRTESSKMGM